MRPGRPSGHIESVGISGKKGNIMLGRHRRRILCIAPAYAPSFGTFQHSYRLAGGIRAFMPPLGILVAAAALPANWQVRFVDENMRAASEADFAWADAVLVTGMHIQRARILDVAARARRHGKTTVLGGPSVSAEPDAYGAFDYLHIGELGDATTRLVERLDDDPRPPPGQVRLVTGERTPLESFPAPAIHLVEMRRYMLGAVQFSSGCPYQCEFCDIPGLYGRIPRLKRPEQVVDELDRLRQAGGAHAVYFVDDNFIGHRRAVRELLPHLAAWQRRHGYPLELACEATVNIAHQPDLLVMMREANFRTVFCGIESPELEALRAMAKGHNAKVPLIEAVETLGRHGLEVVSGMILGLDTDHPATPERIRAFIDGANIPMVTVNLLQALPRTPLWDRLAAEGRLAPDQGRESNVVFRLPYDQVVESWRRLVGDIYRPEELFRRFAHACAHVYPHRLKVSRRVSRAEVARGLWLLFKVLVSQGVLADYRRPFWRLAGPLLRAGRIEDLIHVALVSHHLIRFAREAVAGRENASFYSSRLRERDAA